MEQAQPAVRRSIRHLHVAQQPSRNQAAAGILLAATRDGRAFRLRCTWGQCCTGSDSGAEHGARSGTACSACVRHRTCHPARARTRPSASPRPRFPAPRPLRAMACTCTRLDATESQYDCRVSRSRTVHTAQAHNRPHESNGEGILERDPRRQKLLFLPRWWGCCCTVEPPIWAGRRARHSHTHELADDRTAREGLS